MFDKPLSALFSKLKKWLKNSSLMKIKPINALVFFLKSWWHIVTVTAITVICLYYPLGGWIINDIDTNTDYEIPFSDQLSARNDKYCRQHGSGAQPRHAAAASRRKQAQPP